MRFVGSASAGQCSAEAEPTSNLRRTHEERASVFVGAVRQVLETRELDENTLLAIEAQGNLWGLTLEHARDRADIPHVTFEQVAA